MKILKSDLKLYKHTAMTGDCFKRCMNRKQVRNLAVFFHVLHAVVVKCSCWFKTKTSLLVTTLGKDKKINRNVPSLVMVQVSVIPVTQVLSNVHLEGKTDPLSPVAQKLQVCFVWYLF